MKVGGRRNAGTFHSGIFTAGNPDLRSAQIIDSKIQESEQRMTAKIEASEQRMGAKIEESASQTLKEAMQGAAALMESYFEPKFNLLF